jgi:hypothetical protein
MQPSVSSEKAFAIYVLTYICTKYPEDLRIESEDLSKHLLTLEPKCEVNLFRKQYGNLKDCYKNKSFQAIFRIDANIIIVRKLAEIEAAMAAKVISEKEVALYKEAFLKFTIKERSVWKINDMNVCKVCGSSYKEIINKKGQCKTGDEHKPSYDWKKDGDVMKCNI